MPVLLVVLAIVAGSLIVGGTVVYFLRARYREAVETAGVRPLASGPAPTPAAEEVQAIGVQIERSMAEQRVQGETQRQLMAQKLDEMRQTVEAQRTHVEGIRNEMRHEAQRRDAEMAEIRHQIGSLQAPVPLQDASPAALPPAALPGPPPPPPAASAPAAFEDVPFAAPPPPASPELPPTPETFTASPSFDDVAFDAPASSGFPPGGSSFEDVGFGDAAFGGGSGSPLPDAPSFEDVSFGAFPGGDTSSEPLPSEDEGDDGLFESWAPTPTAPPAPSFEAATFSETFVDAFEAPPAPASAPYRSPASPAPSAALAEEPADPRPASHETAWIARPDRTDAPSAPGLLDLDALAGAPTPAPAPAPLATPEAMPDPSPPPPPPPLSAEPDVPAPFVPPEGAEDLTVLSSVDEDTQRLLYQAGVLTLEEIAQWGRTDARRIGSEVEVSEDTIMNVWVFEAQSALYNRYAQQG